MSFFLLMERKVNHWEIYMLTLKESPHKKSYTSATPIKQTRKMCKHGNKYMYMCTLLHVVQLYALGVLTRKRRGLRGAVGKPDMPLPWVLVEGVGDPHEATQPKGEKKARKNKTFIYHQSSFPQTLCFLIPPSQEKKTSLSLSFIT